MSFCRRLGRFLLAGKGLPVSVCDQVLIGAQPPDELLQLTAAFARGLDRFCSRQWDEAAEVFTQLLQQFPDDGPSRFDLGICAPYASAELPPSWDGTVQLPGRR
jgi:adenylate cyclase